MTNYEEDIQELDKQRIEALSDRDACAYASLCDKLGVEPEDKLLYEQGGLEKNVQGKRSVRKPRKRREIKPELVPKYIQLYQISRQRGLNPDNVFDDYVQKLDLVHEIMGYGKLNASGGERVEIDEAKQSRLGYVFRDAYYRGKRLSEEAKQR